MKRKKWSELEEKTLLSKYSQLQSSGALSKLKTRQKKFQPIADHINSIHNLTDPIKFPFKWTWRDVSIKVQNMRHQYLGVKQKIRVSDTEFNWDDGENHWENFLMYKEVFGDVELGIKENCGNKRVNCDDFEFFGGDEGELGLGFGIDCEGFEGNGEVGIEEEEEDIGGCVGDFDNSGSGSSSSSVQGRRMKRRRIAMLGAKVLELRDVLVKREERRKEREMGREDVSLWRFGEGGRGEVEAEARARAVEGELGLEEWKMRWERREFEREARVEREMEEERRWRMRREEKREEEEMEWRERMLGLQLDHEKQMLQMHADACQNQIHILGVMSKLMCQFFGSASDGFGGVLGGLHPQVLQNLQQPGPGDLGDTNKPGSDSPPEFI